MPANQTQPLISPLLCRSPLRPDESLSSLLARLAELNHYTATGIMKRLCLGGISDNLNRPSVAKTFEQIAALTMLPIHELYTATPHRFAKILTPPGETVQALALPSGEIVSVLSRGVAYDQLRAASAAQFCPHCLDISPYHRVGWLPIAISACLQHECLLLDHCPDCGSHVSIDDVTQTYCGRCGCDLVLGKTVSIAEDPWGKYAQQVIQSWLKLTPSPDQSLPFTLPDQPVAVLFFFLDGLRWCLTGLRSEWPYLHHHPRSTLEALSYAVDARIPYDDVDNLTIPLAPDIRPEDSYSLYATAMKGIVNWPNGFHEFLKIYRLREIQEVRSQLENDFGSLYSDWVKKKWGPLPFVQDAFHQYLVDQYAHFPSVAQPNPLSAQRNGSGRHQTNGYLTYATADEAARLLGISPKAVDRLARAQLLYQFVFPSCWPDKQYKFFRRSEIFDLQHRWQDSISLVDAAKYLGLTQKDTLGLVHSGLLFAERNPGLDSDPDWAFSLQAVTDCYYEVEKSVLYWTTRTTGIAMINLPHAAQMLSAIGLDVVGLLMQMAERNLIGHLPERSCGLGEIVFYEPEIRSFLEDFRLKRGWLDTKKAAKRIGVRESVFMRWVRSGLLAPMIACGDAYFFDPVVVKEFITGYIFTDEAVRIVGVPKEAIHDWMRQGLLKPVSGPKIDGYHRNLFRSADIKRLHSDRLPNTHKSNPLILES
ncbi:MAG: TniQ family protein [Caldilineaceae bacterium]